MIIGKIDAIKKVRELHIQHPFTIEKGTDGRHYLSIGVGLQEAKDFVEDLIAWADQSYYARNPYKEVTEKTLSDFTTSAMLKELNYRHNG